MASSFTTNKNFEKQGSGDHSGTWDSFLNANFDIIDKALGGSQSFTLGSANVAMTQAQLQNGYLFFGGALTANVTVTVPDGIQGHWICYNGTSGAFTVTMKQVSGSPLATLQQGRGTFIFSDGSNCNLANNPDATNATNATNAVNLVNGANQSFVPLATNGYVLASPSGQTLAILKVVYNGATTAGYIQGDAGGLSFIKSDGSAGTFNVTNTGNGTFAGSVADSKGDVRRAPVTVQNTYTLVLADAGKSIVTGTSGITWTVPNALFSSGDMVTFVNGSAGNVTIAQGTSLTLVQGGNATLTTGNRTLGPRGMATLIFTDASTAYISGAGLT